MRHADRRSGPARACCRGRSSVDRMADSTGPRSAGLRMGPAVLPGGGERWLPAGCLDPPRSGSGHHRRARWRTCPGARGQYRTWTLGIVASATRGVHHRLAGGCPAAPRPSPAGSAPVVDDGTASSSRSRGGGWRCLPVGVDLVIGPGIHGASCRHELARPGRSPGLAGGPGEAIWRLAAVRLLW